MANDTATQSDDQGNLQWLWWAGGIFLLLAYCNYSEKDERAEPVDALVGMSAPQIVEYQQCMTNARGYNLSDFTKSSMCRQSALGLDSKLDCHVEWDARANPTVCE